MKSVLLAIAILIAAGGIGFWLFTGANRGWSKTSVPLKTVDEVTGLEGVTYEKRFVPGVDFLGATLALAGIIGIAGAFARKAKS